MKTPISLNGTLLFNQKKVQITFVDPFLELSLTILVRTPSKESNKLSPSNFPRDSPFQGDAYIGPVDASQQVKIFSTTRLLRGKLSLNSPMRRWIQCTACMKWRRETNLLPLESMHSWTCEHSRDARFENSRLPCSVPEEHFLSDEVIIPNKLVPRFEEVDKEMFYKHLFDYRGSVGLPLRECPFLGGMEVDLYRLYREVTYQGGCNYVDTSWNWDSIFRSIPNYDPTIKDGGLALRRIYSEYLAEYELTFYEHRRLSQTGIIREDDASQLQNWRTKEQLRGQRRQETKENNYVKKDSEHRISSSNRGQTRADVPIATESNITLNNKNKHDSERKLIGEVQEGIGTEGECPRGRNALRRTQGISPKPSTQLPRLEKEEHGLANFARSLSPQGKGSINGAENSNFYFKKNMKGEPLLHNKGIQLDDSKQKKLGGSNQSRRQDLSSSKDVLGEDPSAAKTSSKIAFNPTDTSEHKTQKKGSNTTNNMQTSTSDLPLPVDGKAKKVGINQETSDVTSQVLDGKGSQADACSTKDRIKSFPNKSSELLHMTRTAPSSFGKQPKQPLINLPRRPDDSNHKTLKTASIVKVGGPKGSSTTVQAAANLIENSKEPSD